MHLQFTHGVMALGLMALSQSFPLAQNGTHPFRPDLPAIPSVSVTPSIPLLPYGRGNLFTPIRASSSLHAFPANSTWTPTVVYTAPVTAGTGVGNSAADVNAYIADVPLLHTTRYITVIKTVTLEEGDSIYVTPGPENDDNIVCALPTDTDILVAHGNGYTIVSSTSTDTVTVTVSVSNDVDSYTTISSTSTTTSTDTVTMAMPVPNGINSYTTILPTSRSAMPDTGTMTTSSMGDDITYSTTTTTTTSTTTDTVTTITRDSGEDITDTTITSTTTDTITLTLSEADQGSRSTAGSPQPNMNQTWTPLPTGPRLNNSYAQPLQTSTSSGGGSYYHISDADLWNTTRRSAHSQEPVVRTSMYPQRQGSKVFPRQEATWGTATIEDLSSFTLFEGKTADKRTVPTTTAEHPPTPSTPSSNPKKCPDSGRYTIDFDHLPPNTAGRNSSDSLLTIASPINHVFFSEGWFYSEGANSRYRPVSEPHLAFFEPPKEVSAPDSPPEDKARFGAGPSNDLPSFWFDAPWLFFGCDAGSYESFCNVTVSALKYSPTCQSEEIAATSTFYLPTCPGNQKCHLTRLVLGPEFRGLSGVLFEASVNDKPVGCYIDNVAMSWNDTSCAAETERSRSQ